MQHKLSPRFLCNREANREAAKSAAAHLWGSEALFVTGNVHVSVLKHRCTYSTCTPGARRNHCIPA
eukprot:1160714-Pelagomonas_calceolata.AAC.7